MKDHPNTEITNILFVLFIFNLLLEILRKITVTSYLKFHLHALFIYLDTIRKNGSV